MAVDERLLFRFSALTYNAHRIHYDRDWARHEGHADLVIHGPLQALLLAESIRRDGHSFDGRTFGFRFRRPATGAQSIQVSVRDGVDGDKTSRMIVDDQANITAVGSLA